MQMMDEQMAERVDEYTDEWVEERMDNRIEEHETVVVLYQEMKKTEEPVNVGLSEHDLQR